jgi:hypothetical protein
MVNLGTQETRLDGRVVRVKTTSATNYANPEHAVNLELNQDGNRSDASALLLLRHLLSTTSRDR